VRQVTGAEFKGDEVLWKYFKQERFISALKDSQVYFASANEFIDQFEGAVAVQMHAPPKISCWHRAAY
jgi:hypothetical protein